MSWITTKESENIAGFEYDKVKHILTIEFKDNETRKHYKGVLKDVAHEFSMARDKDASFAELIEGQYPTTTHP